MKRKKKSKTPKNLEQLIEEANTKKRTLLKILEKITKDDPENLT